MQPLAAGQPQAAAPTQKQRINVYTMMLVISFICLVTACILLYQELTYWGTYPWWKTDGGKPNVSVSWIAPGGGESQGLIA